MSGQASGARPVSRVALVTGATSDIGEAIALALSGQGSAVAVHTRSRVERAEGLVSRITAEGGQAMVVKGDVGKIDEVKAMVAHAGEGLGTVAVLVNVAATVSFERFLDSDPESWRPQLDSILTGAMNAAWVTAPGMVEAGWGRIINIVAEGALVGEPALAVASAAKAGVLGLTRTLARDLAGNGVTVNAVSPGFIPTDSIPKRFLNPERLKAIAAAYPAGRLGTPEDVAAAVAYLASDAAGYVTGQTISVSGGFSVR